MIIAELVSVTRILPTFHSVAEQVTGENPATLLQNSKRPKAEEAYVLSYFKAFSDPQADLSDVSCLRGLFHLGVVCATTDTMLMEEILASPHGLKTLSSITPNDRWVPWAVLFTGDGAVWASAISDAARGNKAQREWAAVCYSQFAKYDLDFLLRTDPPRNTQGYLTY